MQVQQSLSSLVCQAGSVCTLYVYSETQTGQHVFVCIKLYPKCTDLKLYLNQTSLYTLLVKSDMSNTYVLCAWVYHSLEVLCGPHMYNQSTQVAQHILLCYFREPGHPQDTGLGLSAGLLRIKLSLVYWMD